MTETGGRFRKALSILCLALANPPVQASAIDNCLQCVIGIWDDPTLSSNIGQISPGQLKDLYIGIQFSEGFNELTSIEFSIFGLDGFRVLGVEPIVPTIVILGTIAAPADTSMSSTGRGGMDIAWSSCLVGSQSLAKVTILSQTDVTNRLLEVKRRYPPSDPRAKTPMFTQCASPQYTATRTKGGYYILNWNGDPNVAVSGATWSVVKQLFR